MKQGMWLIAGIALLAGCSVSGPMIHDMPAKRDELWIIEKSTKPQTPETVEAGLWARLPSKPGDLVSMPLRHADVKADIASGIAKVEVNQQFLNPYAERIEAVYVFPLPPEAAVNDFIMTIGERKIRGIIRERSEARRIYDEARKQGYVASLMTQDRANRFTQSVANIEPGKRIDVEIKYFHTLSEVQGWFEFVFPRVAGLNERGVTRRDIAMRVHVDAGKPIEQIESKSHRIIVNRDEKPGQADVTLAQSDPPADRDFVLRYRVAGGSPMVSARSPYEALAQMGRRIKQVVLEYGLLSPFTAFVTVDVMKR